MDINSNQNLLASLLHQLDRELFGKKGLFVILTSRLLNHSISAVTHASCKGVLNARESWSFVFCQLLTAALYHSLSNEESVINAKKEKEKN